MGTDGKAAPIPAEVWTAAKKALRLADKCDSHEDFARRITYIARAIMQDRAAQASQEERVREDERDRLYATDAVQLAPSYGLRLWLEGEGAMLPADRARQRGDAS